MKSMHKPARWLLLLAALSMLAAACGDGGGGAEDGTEPATDATEAAGGTAVEGGTVVFGADQEPEIMNEILTAGNLAATVYVVAPILLGAYQLQPDFTYQPMLIDGEAEIVSEDPFTVRYNILEEATWSDGEPITAEDFKFTAEVYRNEDFDITSRAGWEKMTDSGTVVDDKTYEVSFEEPFAPYRLLFDPVLPKHELEGKDMNEVWNDEITLASGPFEFDSWNKGRDATIKRNESFWGEPAHLDEIVFRFLEDSNTQVQALKGGEIDMFYPQPQVDLVEQVEAIDDVTSEASAGPVWEHLDFNFHVKPLDQQFVRAAIAHGIDRDALAQQLIAPMYPEIETMQQVIYVPNQDEYEPHFDKWNYDPEAAEALLTDNGCTKGDDGIYECDGKKLSFRYTTTAGNELRELQLQVIQQQLKAIGIEIKPDVGEAATVFADVLPNGPKKAWDLFNFAWVGSPDPFSGNSIWQCDGGQNYNGYCNEEVTELLDKTDTLIDEAERAATFNEADALMADDLPVLPLYQKPTFIAYNNRIQGVVDNPTNAGPTWNAGEWQLTE